MPIYEYKCRSCEKVIEVIQKFSDEPLTVHEGCGGELERLLGSPALMFKGAGWYVNDYARAGSGKSNGSKSGESSSESKSAESKSESKTESKPAASAKTD